MNTCARGRVIVVIPVYNEELNIRPLIDELDHELTRASIGRYHIIIVNDGSTDGTSHVLKAYAAAQHVTILSHDANQGFGASLRDGLVAALSALNSIDGVVVTMDGDQSHPPSLIASMVCGVATGYDVVIASRYQEGGNTAGVPLVRRLASAIACSLLRLTFPIKGVTDYTCGYRAYHPGVLRAVLDGWADSRPAGHFASTVDILLSLRGRGANLCEIPLTLRYDWKRSASKMRLFHNAWSVAVIIMLHLARRLVEWRTRMTISVGEWHRRR